MSFIWELIEGFIYLRRSLPYLNRRDRFAASGYAGRIAALRRCIHRADLLYVRSCEDGSRINRVVSLEEKAFTCPPSSNTSDSLRCETQFSKAIELCYIHVVGDEIRRKNSPESLFRVSKSQRYEYKKASK